MLRSAKPTGYTFDLVLWGTKPPVWRRLHVPSDITLRRLHLAVQAAMGWRDYHLFEFKFGKERIGLPFDEFDGDMPDWDARTKRLSSLHLDVGDALTYVYDFGDHWLHLLVVADLHFRPIEVPFLDAGDGACPPEDVGGIGGYAEFLEVLADPEHEEHERYATWGRGWWLPFDLDEANRRLSQAFTRRVRKAGGPPPVSEGPLP